MILRNKLLAVSFACCLLVTIAGCTSGGFYGRFIILNSSDETIQKILLSPADQYADWVREDPKTWMKKSWEVTENGQGWITKSFGPVCTAIDVSWTDESGEKHQSQIDFTEAAGYRSSEDLIIEFEVEGVVRWRLVSKH